LARRRLFRRQRQCQSPQPARAPALRRCPTAPAIFTPCPCPATPSVCPCPATASCSATASTPATQLKPTRAPIVPPWTVILRFQRTQGIETFLALWPGSPRIHCAS
jgi:hypothetical protein